MTFGQMIPTITALLRLEQEVCPKGFVDNHAPNANHEILKGQSLQRRLVRMIQISCVPVAGFGGTEFQKCFSID